MISIKIICLIIGYVCGLFQTGVILGKINNFDLKKEGSGNSGMTNAIRTKGWKIGILVFLGDSLKCVLAIVVVYLLFRNSHPDMVKLFELYAGLGAILGNNYPFYLKFKGGKGIACSAGMVFSTYVWMVPICAGLFFLTVVPTGFISIGSLMIISSYLVQMIVFGQLGMLGIASGCLLEAYIVTAIITAIGFIRHKENIKRLATGTEKKFYSKKK